MFGIRNLRKPRELSQPNQLDMVGERGFEPPTPWSRRLDARETNNLHRVRPTVMECAGIHIQQCFPAIRRHSVTLDKVWWLAQNWAQSREDRNIPSRPRAWCHEHG